MIKEAVLHVDVVWKDKKTFLVLGISSDTDKNDRKWYLFAEDDQVPSVHPQFETDILKLRVKNFRNMCVNKNKLTPYLAANRKSFQFKSVVLVCDLENSIHENEDNDDDGKDVHGKRKAAARTSNPKIKKRSLQKVSGSQCQQNLNEFLKGQAQFHSQKSTSVSLFCLIF